MPEILAVGVSRVPQVSLRPGLAQWPAGKGNGDQAWSYKLKLLTSEPQQTAASQLGNREILGAQREDPHGPPSTVTPPPPRTHHGWGALKQLSSHFCSELREGGR